MKKIHENLTKQLELLRLEIEKREEIFSNRSENWQESEKGEEFEMATQELEQVADDLENTIDELFNII